MNEPRGHVPIDILKAIETFDALTSRESVVFTLKSALASVGRKYFCLNLFPQRNESFANAIIACELSIITRLPKKSIWLWPDVER